MNISIFVKALKRLLTKHSINFVSRKLPNSAGILGKMAIPPLHDFEPPLYIINRLFRIVFGNYGRHLSYIMIMVRSGACTGFDSRGGTFF